MSEHMHLADKITITAMTDIGMVRTKNEDTIGYDSALGLMVLADGMGGHRGGEVASSMTVDTIIVQLQQQLPNIKPGQTDSKSGYSLESMCILEAIESANDLVFKAGDANPSHNGMGTTIVTLHFYNNTLSLAHIGDSRCYRLRANAFEQITKDHSLLQELVDRGFYTSEEARSSQNKNLVTRALGIDPLVAAEIYEDTVHINDIYLLCSDGLTDYVEDQFIYLTISRFSDNLEEAAKQLITKANQNGGKDNISVMLCRINDDFSVEHSWFNKLIARFD